jgi:hypothetical protein
MYAARAGLSIASWRVILIQCATVDTGMVPGVNVIDDCGLITPSAVSAAALVKTFSRIQSMLGAVVGICVSWSSIVNTRVGPSIRPGRRWLKVLPIGFVTVFFSSTRTRPRASALRKPSKLADLTNCSP